MALTLKTNFGYPSNKAWGSLWYKGSGSATPLGSGAYNVNYVSPVQVGGGTTWSEVIFSTAAISGTGHLLRSDGTLWAWGSNEYGQLGLNVAWTSLYYSPTQIGALTNWKTLGILGTSCGAIKTDGTLWTWGDNTGGALGQNSPDSGAGRVYYTLSPVQVGALTNWLQLSGCATRIALKTDGTLWQWGSSIALGNNTNGLSYSSPVQIGALTTWAQVSGYSDCHAIKTDGTLWGWGTNIVGNVGNGTTSPYSSPVQIGALTTWAKVFDGPNATFAIKTDGTLWGWGSPVQGVYNNGLIGNGSTAYYSSPVQIGALTDWNKVVSGYHGVVALKNNGTLWAWGYVPYYAASYSSPVQVGSGTSWVSATPASDVVNSSFYGIKSEANDPGNTYVTKDYLLEVYPNLAYTLGAKATPKILKWGYNGLGEIGNGTVVSYSSPVQVGSLTTWKVMSSKGESTAAIKTDGTLWMWGENTSGQLGNGTVVSYSSPIQIGALTNWLTASSGPTCLALKTDGTIWGWGLNTYGAIGDSTTTSRSSPVQIGAGNTWKQVINNGSLSSYGIKTDGSLWAWGRDDFGQLGHNEVNGVYRAPAQVGLLTDWKQVSCTPFAVAVVKTNGSLWAWGDNTYGGVGNSTTTNYSSPIQIGALTNWGYVAVSGYFTMAIKTDGTLWGWGYNPYGNLGNDTRTNYSSPIQIGALTNWSKVYSTSYSTFAIKTDGTLWAWGYNANGELGSGTVVNYSSPIQIGTLTTWKSVTKNGGIIDGYF